ncbi:Metallo-dependent phosphatase [Coprinopsis marcescibilis]|uniref:Metallo-dependent phosphatase n=1 Tax=Coprinopsis marcescibilis TaxID=230819 RepID=A0A5C3KUV7_COPMA|nr:Metallo-dependent phosphatase [Coprinopsis marcescibilis]
MARYIALFLGLSTCLALIYLVHSLRFHLLFLSAHQIDFIRHLVPQFSGLHSRTFRSNTALIKSYEGSRKSFKKHIVAVGDLHGDLANARRVLQFSGVVDDEFNWSRNVDYFVQTGDIIDRGDDTIALFLWMERLRAQAIGNSSTMLSNLGNHEWMNMIGDWRYVYPTEIKTFGSIEARQRMLSSGRIGRAWAQNYTTTTRLPLHPSIGPPNTQYPPKDFQFAKESGDELEHHLSLYRNHKVEPMSHAAISFVHGGLAEDYENLTPFPTKINKLSKSLMRKLQYRKKQPTPHPPGTYPGWPESATMEEINMYYTNGPLWYRGWAQLDEATACKKVDNVLARTGTRRMIMGHTPDFHNIVARCKGKIIIIDTGISHAYGGVLSALSIDYELHPVGEDSEQRWVEREIVKAVYAERKEVLVADEREIIGDFQVS